ncbi:hypothetical protein ACHZ98_22990 [Streptomyces sp. MAR4 CNY-716]
MGDRADYVLVRGGDRRLHYSRWGATGVDVQLLPGAGSATRFIAAQREMARDAWLDEVWCEGAALVDHDAHELLLFTWHPDDYVQPAGPAHGAGPDLARVAGPLGVRRARGPRRARGGGPRAGAQRPGGGAARKPPCRPSGWNATGGATRSPTSPG